MTTRNTQVGDYFRLGEFWDRRAQALPPVASQIPIARMCCLLLDPLRRKFGPTTVNSGYRTPATNVVVGGASASRHLYDRFPLTPAADVSCAKGTPAEWAAFLETLLRGQGGLGVYRGHVHVDRRPIPSRWNG